LTWYIIKGQLKINLSSYLADGAGLQYVKQAVFRKEEGATIAHYFI
jgi:hypothetical protein